jgi:large conductance mechanosensitive channel
MGILNEKHRYWGEPAIVADSPLQLRARHPGTGLYSGAFWPDTSTLSINKWSDFMGMMQEFKEFAIKGNVMDLAVGVIIGAAFGKIVDSVVGDLIMPVVGTVFGKLDFSSLFVVLGQVPAGTGVTLDALRKAGVPVLAYGSFITVAVNFSILAFIIFMMVKQVNRLKKSTPPEVEAPAPAVTAEDVLLLREIRDSLKR